MCTAHDLRYDVEWLPVVYLDGRRASLPLQRLLEDAHLIKELEGEPAQWAALMRFLPSVTALIAREDPHADFDAWATDGFPSSAINACLDRIANHLWLRHPSTPFMQDPLIDSTGVMYPTEWLHLTSPGPNSKAWWGKFGDHIRADANAHARVALGLVTSWYFNPGAGGKASGQYTDAAEVGWRPRGTVGVHNHGLRIFHRGPTLASTLLANTMDTHVTARGANLPLWASDASALPSSGPLTASTWTGSAYLLRWDGEQPVGVYVAGRRHQGYSADPTERKLQTRAIEKDVWRSDPTIPRYPVTKAGEETGDVRPLRSLHPSANTVQWMAEWYTVDAKRGTVRSLEPGLVEVNATDTFVIQLDGPITACEISYIARVGELAGIANPQARSRLRSLSAMVITPLRTTLYIGLIKALGEEAARPLHDRLFAAFCGEAEPHLDELVHAETMTVEHARAFTGAAVTAFERFLRPYLNSRTLAGGSTSDGIAAAMSFVHTRVAASLRDVR